MRTLYQLMFRTSGCLNHPQHQNMRPVIQLSNVCGQSTVGTFVGWMSETSEFRLARTIESFGAIIKPWVAKRTGLCERADFTALGACPDRCMGEEIEYGMEASWIKDLDLPMPIAITTQGNHDQGSLLMYNWLLHSLYESIGQTQTAPLPQITAQGIKLAYWESMVCGVAGFPQASPPKDYNYVLAFEPGNLRNILLAFDAERCSATLRRAQALQGRAQSSLAADLKDRLRLRG